MQPIFKEMIKMWSDMGVNLDISEGAYWLDNSIIKCFNSEDGSSINLYRLTVSDDLKLSYKEHKDYKKLKGITIETWKETVERNKDHLKELENESINLINNISKKYYDHEVVSLTSGGKDSSVTMYLVRKLFPESKGIFNNTSLDCADTYIHIKSLKNINTINPKEGFYQWRKRNNFVPTRLGRACCTIFKEGAMVQNLDKTKKFLFFMGMRNAESNTRSGYGDEWSNDKWSKNWTGCLPIRKWNELDIWLYIMMNNIDFNPKYRKGYSRSGCSCACPYYSKSTWLLDKYWYPVMYNRWREILKDDFISNNKWLIMNCTLEEYIDKAWNGGTFRDEATTKVIEEYANYNNLDYNIAKKYFDKFCINGCLNRKKKPLKIKDKETLGMNMKLYGRQIEKFKCKKCLMKELNMNEDEWQNRIRDWKDQGCKLF